MFFRGSRYERIADTELTDRGGRIVRYKRMRFVPVVDGTLADIVREGDRPDLVAYRALGDPEQFWRLCDANREMRPSDLTKTPGRRLLLPGPGVLGTPR
jgi:hypothetical protein